jgi:hypothetical protein
MPSLLTASNLSYGAEIIQVCDDAYFRLITGASTSSDAAQTQVNEFVAAHQLIDQISVQELKSNFSASLENLTLQVISSISNVRYKKTVNLHAPLGKSFQTIISKQQNMVGYPLHNIAATDGDGDFVNCMITSGNFDKDQDGRNAFALTNLGELTIMDPHDVNELTGHTIRLLIRLDDGRGQYSTLEGLVSIQENTPMGASPVTSSWFESPWFGTFFVSKDGWIYHLTLGWLYYKTDGLGGYWFWDDSWSSWWWSTHETFPWIYRDDTKTWVYIYNDAGNVMLYDQESMKWRRRK